MSSSSSLGSLSTSSRGSASSLSFTDIYGGGLGGLQYCSGEDIAQSVANLQKRVNEHLSSNTELDKQHAEKMKLVQEGGLVLSHSTLSLSPRSSLSSLSPPTSSCEPLPPFTDLITNNMSSNTADSDEYNTTLTPTDITNTTSTNCDFNLPESSVNPHEGDLECDEGLKAVNQKLKEAGLLLESGISNLDLGNSGKSHELRHLDSHQNLSQYLQQAQSLAEACTDAFESPFSSSSALRRSLNKGSQQLNDTSSAEHRPLMLDLSPLMGASSAMGGDSDSGGGGRGTMSAAVSDESVAGDSGVYEAYPKASPDYPNAPQIQIKLKWVFQFRIAIKI